MESGSRYTEGPVLLNTRIGLNMEQCGYKLGSTKLFCIIEEEEEFNLRTLQGGNGTWVIKSHGLYNVPFSVAPLIFSKVN